MSISLKILIDFMMNHKLMENFLKRGERDFNLKEIEGKTKIESEEDLEFLSDVFSSMLPKLYVRKKMSSNKIPVNLKTIVGLIFEPIIY